LVLADFFGFGGALWAGGGVAPGVVVEFGGVVDGGGASEAVPALVALEFYLGERAR
jgi:hypothetical protein